MEYCYPQDVKPPKSPLLAPVWPRLEPDPLNRAEAQNLRQLSEDPLRFTSATPQAPKNPRPRGPRKRFALPLLVDRPSGAVTLVIASPDSGSDENIISLELVTSMGLRTEQTTSGEPRKFTVANGKIVTAIGQVSARCRFAAGAPSDVTSLECIFHVFDTLAVPLIMGVDFLQQTETLSKHRDRLVEQVVPSMQSLRVNSIGRPKRSLVCRLDTYVGCATVDTGSDLNLVSPAFAKARAYNIEPAYEQLEFADCSVGCTSGVIKTSLVVGNVNSQGFYPRGEPIQLELHVLDGLNADILVGQDTVDALDVFNLHSESLIPSMPRLGESDLNIIRHIGRLEQIASDLWKKIRGNPSDGATGGPEAQVDVEQWENARRELERARIAKLPGSEQQRAQELEYVAIYSFESERQKRLSHLSGTPKPFTPPVSASRFFSQHGYHRRSWEEPGYPCPVKECSNHFKLAKDAIRHYEVIHSARVCYICPFCPDREHKYPRPDCLQRHVLLRHADKDINDPLLRDVLARGPE